MDRPSDPVIWIVRDMGWGLTWFQGGCIPGLHTGGTAAANIASLVWRSCASKIVRQKTNATVLLTTCFCGLFHNYKVICWINC